MILYQINLRQWNITKDSGDSFALLVVNVYTLYIVYNNNITHPQNRFNNIVKSQGGVGKYKKVTTSTNYLKTVLNPY